MLIEVKALDSEGNLVFEGKFNQKEVSFLLQYSVNDLLHQGIQFNLEQENEEEVRFGFPDAKMND